MAIPVVSTIDFSSGARITGLAAGSATGHPVTYEQLQATIEGLNWKDDVRVASTANINLAAPGTTIDGITMSASDRFLAKDQTNAYDNGIYIWNSSGGAATRAADMSASTEFNSAVVSVNSGTAGAGTTWRQTAVNPTVGTTNVVFTSFSASAASASETTAGVAEIATQGETDAGSDDLRFVTPLKLATYANKAKRYATDVGDGSATSYTITHNLGTRDVQVMVRRNSGSYEQVLVEWGAATTTTVILVFATAPTSAQFRVIVLA